MEDGTINSPQSPLAGGRNEDGSGVAVKETDEFWEEPRGTVGRRWRYFFLMYYGRWITHPIVKVVILLVFAVYLGVSVYGFLQLPQGLELRQLAPDNSYLQDFEDDLAQCFSKYGPATHVLFPDAEGIVKWQSPEIQHQVQELTEKLNGAYYTHTTLSPMEVYFNSAYGGRLFGTANSTSPNTDLTGSPVGQEAFIKSFKEFLEDPLYRRFQKDTAWSGDRLIGWRLLLLPRYYPKSVERGVFMDNVRKDVAAFPDLKAIAFNYYFIFFESDLEILPSVVQNLCLAAVSMLAVALLLIPRIVSALLVILTIAMIDLGLFGFMYYWGLQLNMITMINLVISIGFSIDYSAHICHTFTHCEGETRDLRAIESLVLMGNPVFHGASSTQMGVIMLAFSSSFVFRVFFRMMTLVLLFGASHGIIFLPVMLSLVGPMPQKSGSQDTPLAVKDDETEALSNDPENETSTGSSPECVGAHDGVRQRNFSRDVDSLD
eukprot:Filipodium_phascolosomae@DN3307_c0_g1_i1.p1